MSETVSSSGKYFFMVTPWLIDHVDNIYANSRQIQALLFLWKIAKKYN